MPFKKHPYMLIAVLLALLTTVLLGMKIYHLRGVRVIVSNSGSGMVLNVHVALGGGQIALGDVSPNTSASGYIVPAQDSDVSISFTDATGQFHSSQAGTYVTNHMSGKVEANIQNNQLKFTKEDLHISPF